MVIDFEVMDAKLEFYKKMQKALKSDIFPSKELEDEAFILTNACQRALRSVNKLVQNYSTKKNGCSHLFATDKIRN